MRVVADAWFMAYGAWPRAWSERRGAYSVQRIAHGEWPIAYSLS